MTTLPILIGMSIGIMAINNIPSIAPFSFLFSIGLSAFCSLSMIYEMCEENKDNKKKLNVEKENYNLKK